MSRKQSKFTLTIKDKEVTWGTDSEENIAHAMTKIFFYIAKVNNTLIVTIIVQSTGTVSE